MEKKEVVVVLDAGTETPAVGPELFCCALTFGFFR